MNRKIGMKRIALTLSFAAFLMIGAGAGKTRAQTVWAGCYFDISSIYKLKNNTEKFERRLYVSPVISMTRAEFSALQKTDGQIGGACLDYFNETVVKAAEARGEKLSITNNDWRVIHNVEATGANIGSKEGAYRFLKKEDVEATIADKVKEMKDADRAIVDFNWDLSGKNKEEDLAKEIKRIPVNIAPFKP